MFIYALRVFICTVSAADHVCSQTFCAKCLHRSMDHNDACPLCREPLPAYTYFQEGWCNEAILKIRALLVSSHTLFLLTLLLKCLRRSQQNITRMGR